MCVNGWGWWGKLGTVSEMTPKLSFKRLTRIELADRLRGERPPGRMHEQGGKALKLGQLGWSQTKEFKFCLKTESI